MNKSILAALIICFTFSTISATGKNATESKMEWWNSARFGMFVHWGPYCLYGGVYNGYKCQRPGAEWIMNACKIPVMEYRVKSSTFNPSDFCADSLVLVAKRAGMKYLVFTAKHHDGFAMFETQTSRYNIVDYTPYGRDIVDQIVLSCRKYGLRFGFYYSQCQDWNNPGGATLDRYLPQYGFEHPESDLINDYVKTHNGSWDPIQQSRTFDSYFDEVAMPQISELLSRYPDVGCIFFDTPRQMTKYAGDKLHKLLEQYPDVIINDRMYRPDYPGDYKTPEHKIPLPEEVENVYWETCTSIGSSWGYKSWEEKWKTTKSLIRSLIQIAARGGNLLLNVGPDPNGNIPDEAKERLDSIGNWLQIYGDAIYGTQRSGFSPTWGEITAKNQNGKSYYYCFVLQSPKNNNITIDGNIHPRSVVDYVTDEPLKYRCQNGCLNINIPSGHRDNPYVVKIELKTTIPEENLLTNTQKHFAVADE